MTMPPSFRASATLLLVFVGLAAGTFTPGKVSAQRLPGRNRGGIGGFHSGEQPLLPSFMISAGFSDAAAAGTFGTLGDSLGLAFHAGKLYPAWADNSTSLSDNPDLTRLDTALTRVDLNANGTTTTGTPQNISQSAGNQLSPDIAVNPADPQNLVVVSAADTGPGVVVAVSTDGGGTWARRIMATGTDFAAAGGPPSVTFDSFGNCFLAYRDISGKAVPILLSTDGGASFTSLAGIPYGEAGNPVLATGPGGDSYAASVWLAVMDFGGAPGGSGAGVLVSGAPSVGLGVVGAFRSEVAPASADAVQPSLAVGPSGEVALIYQDGTSPEGPSTLYAHVDTDGLGIGGLSGRVAVATTNVGGSESITPDNRLNATPSIAFDRSSAHPGRLYLVYADEVRKIAVPDPDGGGDVPSYTPTNETNDTDIFLHYSDDGGKTWPSAGIIGSVGVAKPLRLNEDPGSNSQFLPRVAVDQTTGNVGIVWYDARNDTGPRGGADDQANTDVQVWGLLITRGTAPLPAANGVPTMSYDSLRKGWNLTWRDNSNNELGFLILRSRPGETNIPYPIAVVGPDEQSFFDPDERYAGVPFRVYRVLAFNLGGYTFPQEVGAMDVADDPLPAAPAELKTTEAPTLIRLNWKDNSRREGFFRIFRWLKEAPGVPPVELRAEANQTTFDDVTALPDVAYAYQVIGHNDSGDSGPTLTAVGKRGNAPSALRVDKKSSTAVCIEWDYAGATALGFQVERKSATGQFHAIGRIARAVPEFMDTDVYPETAYVYRVRAFSFIGVSGYSDELPVTVPPPPPAAPSGLTASAVSSSRIDLTWVKNSTNETGFQIERTQLPSGPVTMLMAAANTFSKSDTGLLPSTSYGYRIRAVNPGGESAFTTPATARTLAGPPTGPTNLQCAAVSPTEIRLSWSDNSSDETGFRIERKSGGSDFTQVAVTLPNTTAFSDTLLDPSVAYTYHVIAVSPAGDSDASNEVTCTTPAVQGKIKAPVVLNFGVGPLNKTKTKPLSLKNVDRSSTLWVSVPQADPPFHIDSAPFASTIPPRGGLRVFIKFTPTARGLVTKTLTIATGDPLRPVLRVTLKGKGR